MSNLKLHWKILFASGPLILTFAKVVPRWIANARVGPLGYPDDSWGMVVLTPDQQAMLVDAEPEIFRPVPGGWGKRGSTNVNLAASDPVTLKSALTMAWSNRLAKGGAKQSSAKQKAATPPPARKTKKTGVKKAPAKKTGVTKRAGKSRTTKKTRISKTQTA